MSRETAKGLTELLSPHRDREAAVGRQGQRPLVNDMEGSLAVRARKESEKELGEKAKKFLNVHAKLELR